jgi:putative endonuclease
LDCHSERSEEPPHFFRACTTLPRSPTRDHEYYVYLLGNSFHRLYTGVTNNLELRVGQHKAASDPRSFTARYKIDRLVYFERFQYVEDAIRRETQIKGWLCVKKIALIVQHNLLGTTSAKIGANSSSHLTNECCARQPNSEPQSAKCGGSSLRSE